MLRRINSSYHRLYRKRFLPMIESYARHFQEPRVPLDELVLIGEYQLLYAMRHYDRTRGSFRAYLGIRLRSLMKAECDARRHDPMPLENVLQTETYVPPATNLIVNEVMATLEPREQEIIWSHLVDDLSLNQVSRDLEIPAYQVRKQFRAAMRKIRARFPSCQT